MLNTTVQIRFRVMKAARAYDIVLGQDWLARVAVHTAHYNRVYEVAGQYVVQCDRHLRASTREEYDAGSVVEQDVEANGARRCAAKSDDEAPELHDTDSDSDGGDDVMFDEVFAQLGFDGEFEDDGGVIGPDPEHMNVRRPLGYGARAAVIEAMEDIDINPDLPPAVVTEVWKMLRAHDRAFAADFSDLERTTRAMLRIHLKPGAIPRRCGRMKRYGQPELAFIKRQVDSLMAAGLIIPITCSEWLAPIVVAAKKGLTCTDSVWDIVHLMTRALLMVTHYLMWMRYLTHRLDSRIIVLWMGTLGIMRFLYIRNRFH